jgi:hypothetical protein
MPGTITRDAARGLLTITGGTVSAPVTCADIIAAATAGGWSTVISSGDALILLDHVAFGTIATPCNFADTRKMIQVGLPGARRGFTTTFNGTFRLGEKVNGVGVDGCKLALYLDNNSASAQAAFSGVAYPAQIYVSQFYGSSLDLNYTGTGFTEFVVNGNCEWLDADVSANGTVYFAAGATGTVKRVRPNYARNGYAFYQYSPNLLMEDVDLSNVQAILSGGTAATFTGIDFGTKELRRYYAALVTCNDCTIPDEQITNTEATANAYVRKYFTHTTQALYAGAALAGVKVRMSVSSGGAQDYAGTTDAGGLVSGGLVLAKQHNWAATTNAYTLDDKSAKTLRLRKYGKRFVEQALTLDAKAIAVVPMQDEAVTLTAQATVAAWTSVSNLKQLYEVSRHYGEADLSLPDPVVLAGGVLDFGAYNVVLNTAAAAVWAVSGNTVTIKCAASVASAADALSIKTMGTVTLTGVTAGFGIVDAAGDSYLEFTGIDSWIVYSDPGRTVQVGAGTGSQLFRFVYAAGVTRYLKCVSGSTEFAMVATATAPGATVVSLSTQALLTTLQAAVGAVKSDTGLIKALSL